MAEALYRLKSAGGGFTWVTGTAPIAVTGLNEGEAYEYPATDGTLGEVTAGAATGDTTPPAFNSESYDSDTSTFTADVSEDSEYFYVYSSTNIKMSKDQAEVGQESDGSFAPLAGSFSVSGTGTTNQQVDTSSLSDATYYIFRMLKDPAGNRSDVTDAITDTKVTPVINYVNQATNDAAFEITPSGVTGFDHWFFALSIKATTPEDAFSRISNSGVGFEWRYGGAGSTTIIVRNSATTIIYRADYPLNLDTRQHLAFKYDGLTGTPTFWVDGATVSPSSVTTAATTGSIYGISGTEIFDRDSGGRSVEAEEVSQLVVSTSDLSISDVWDSTAGEPVKDISGLSAEIIFGGNMTASDWNSASNQGSAASDGYTLNKIGGNFVDV